MFSREFLLEIILCIYGTFDKNFWIDEISKCFNESC